MPGGGLESAASLLSGNVGLADASPSGGLAGYAVPAWLAGKSLNTWYQLSGSAGFGGVPSKFGGFNIAGSKIVYFTSEGHGSGYNNAVKVLDLGADSPAWATLMASSGLSEGDVFYYSDGKPAARHTYDSTFYLPDSNKLLSVGFRFGYPSAATGGMVDAFDLTLNRWDGVVAGSPGTSGSGYTTAPSGAYGAVMDEAGNIWTNSLGHKYSIVGNSWTTAPVTNTHIGRYPICLDTTRNQLFGLSYNNGEGAGTEGRRAGILTNGASATTGISFTSTDGALTAFDAQQGAYAAMTYIPPLDVFWQIAVGSVNVYVITPNDTATWDMSLLPATGTAPSGVGAEALVGKLKYIPSLGIVVFARDQSTDLYYRRVV